MPRKERSRTEQTDVSKQVEALPSRRDVTTTQMIAPQRTEAAVFGREVNPREISDSLDRDGVAILKGILDGHFIAELMKEIKRLESAGLLEPRETPSQKFGLFTFGKDPKATFEGFPRMAELERAYRGLYNVMAKERNFPGIPEGKVMNSIGVYLWPKGDGHTDWHKDAEFFMNLIAVVTVSGKAGFSIENPVGEQHTYAVAAGDITLIDGYTNQDKRRLHDLNGVSETRYTIMFRWADQDNPAYNAVIEARKNQIAGIRRTEE